MIPTVFQIFRSGPLEASSSASLLTPNRSVPLSSFHKTMSVVEPQVAEQVSVHEDDQEAELDNHPPRDAITSEQSEPGDSEPEAQSESGALSLPDAKLDENAVPQELEQAQVVQAAEAIPVRKVSGTATPTKEPMSVSTNVAKANGGPTTPLVKKVGIPPSYRPTML